MPWVLRVSWHWRFWYVGVAFYTVSWQPVVFQVGPLSVAVLHAERNRR